VKIFRSLLIDPVAIEAQVIVEPSCFGVEGVIQEGGICRRQSAHTFRLLFQLIEQYREDERTGIVIRICLPRSVMTTSLVEVRVAQHGVED